MVKRRIVSYKSLPVRLPIGELLALGLLLDRLHVPEWAWGIFAVVCVLAILGVIAEWRGTIEVDIFT